LGLFLSVQIVDLYLFLLGQNVLVVLADVDVHSLLLLPQQLGDHAVVVAVLGYLDLELLFEVDDVVVEGDMQPVGVLLGLYHEHVQR
jgi:hypothetical protein